MKLLLNNEIIELENNEVSIKLVFENISQAINSGELALSHLIVDEIEVFNDFEDYLLGQISSIESIKAIIKPKRELVNDLFLTTEEYLKRAIPDMELLINEFYQSPTSNSWEKFNDFLSGLQWIDQVIRVVDEGTYQPVNWNKYLFSMATVQEVLKNLENAISSNDHILMADIIKYEILPELETLKNELGNSIDQEGKRNHVN